MVKDNFKVCIFGATGFLGRHLLKALSKEPGVNIKALTRDKSKLEKFPVNVQAVEGDLLDLDSLAGFIEPGSIVINLAYLSSEPRKINIKAVENLSTACLKEGAARLVHCSTAVVVGHVKDNVITEKTACFPITEYEKTKFEIEELLLERLEDKCEIVIARPTAVFGEGGKNLLKLANELTNDSRLIRMVKISLYSKRKLNLVYIENVEAAIWFMAKLDGDISGEGFIIADSGAAENNYFDVVNMLSEHFGIKPVSPVHLPFNSLILSLLLRFYGRSNANPKRIYNSEKLIRKGFKYPVSFQDGIKLFADWFNNKE